MAARKRVLNKMVGTEGPQVQEFAEPDFPEE